MRDELELRAMEHYAEQVRQGTGDLYACYRLYERHFVLRGVRDAAELVRKAMLTIFTADPYALATAFPFDMGVLTESELEQIAAAATFGGDEEAASLLRGQLWANAGRRKDSPEEYLRRAVGEIEAVPAERRRRDDWRALADCYQRLDYERFKQAIPMLLAASEPEWRAFDLIRALNDVATHEDWEEYSMLRQQWEELPPNAHFCECYFNNLHTADGLLALHRDDLQAAREALVRSMDVNGCPHLNTGGGSLRLARALIERNTSEPDVLAYLDFCDRSRHGEERTRELREMLTREDR